MVRRPMGWRGAALAGALVLARGAAAQAPAVPGRVQQQTAAVALKDDRKALVTLHVPLALHRPANRFRLYGARPLTLHSRDRRRDLYHDAFLELATRRRALPPVNAWDTLRNQLSWAGAPAAVKDPAAALSEISRRVQALPGYRNFQAVSRLLGEPKLDVAQPVMQVLELRALATDAAEQRLLLLGQALDVEAPGTDPAMRDGYRAARAEFEQVRQAVWPAVTESLRKNQGRLIVSAIREIAFSKLGFWSMFGYLGWQGVEGALNCEYHGQYAICLANLATTLEERSEKQPAGAGYESLASYAEYALDYELTEALKQEQVMPLKAAGGRTASDWQIQFSNRCTELKSSFAEGS